MYPNKLITELGLLPLVRKQQQQTTVKPTASEPTTTNESNQAPPQKEQHNQKIDKNEFRLLVKMLQAIQHECQFDHIQYDGQKVSYKLPNITLIFHDIHIQDDDQTMNLSSLSDILKHPELKRPVWEKLKTIKS